MTLHELSKLYWLKQEIATEQERLREIESKAYGAGASRMGAAPGGSDPGRKTERYAVMIENIRETIKRKVAQSIEERERLEQYIAGIDDPLIRQIFVARFVDGKTWAEVAYTVGGWNTPDSVKKACYRYLKAHKGR